MKQKHIKILNTKIYVSNICGAIEEIKRAIDNKRKMYVCCAPVSTVMQAKKDHEYQKALDRADMVLPDGMPLVWILKLNGAINVGRVCGIDLMEQICYHPYLRGLKLFFFGTTEQTLNSLKKRLLAFNPSVKIVGMIAPPFREKAIVESQEVIDKINLTKPDILFVGLGSPKQDFWMELHRSHLDVPVMIGVGAAFDFLAGIKPRAPKWIQNNGLEWLFRLCCEPKRLCKRYIILNSQFCYEIFFHYLLMKGRKDKDVRR
jgi:N-acetylglucosaminyldiphosphoundecaprenol N-acetyl-beta-D-mannosaminyltransferase